MTSAKMVQDLGIAALRLRDAVEEADLSFIAVLESDGDQLTRDLGTLVEAHPSDESLRVCQSARALLSSMLLLHRGAYSSVTTAACGLLGDVVEYALSMQPGIPEAERSTTEDLLRRLREKVAEAILQRDCP